MSESKIWTCKIGEVDSASVPDGGDLPMRMAVEEAYFALTGQNAKFNFSGWGAKLDECERAVVENRMPSDEYFADKRKREAAPELYEALASLLQDVKEYVRVNNLADGDGKPASNDAMRRAEAALLKATPEQSDV